MDGERAQPRGRLWWLVALVAAGAIAVGSQRGEVEEVLETIRHVAPLWWLAAIGLQALTYLCAAGVWQLALASNGHRQPLGLLVRLAFAMLFSNQALPSVGISGGLLVSAALVRRGVLESVAAGALVLGLLSTYAAFLAAWIAAIPVVRHVHYALILATTTGAAFAVMAAGATVFVIQARRVPMAWRVRLQRLPLVGTSLSWFTATPPRPQRSWSIRLRATALQLTEVIVDGCTLNVSLLSVGWHLPVGRVVACYVLASVASRVAFVPLGLGTFEAACVTFLHAAGLPIAPALATTLIFRGFTLWLPMAPGLWYARSVVARPE